MKKIIGVMLLIFLALFLLGCTEGNEGTTGSIFNGTNLSSGLNDVKNLPWEKGEEFYRIHDIKVIDGKLVYSASNFTDDPNYGPKTVVYESNKFENKYYPDFDNMEIVNGDLVYLATEEKNTKAQTIFKNNSPAYPEYQGKVLGIKEIGEKLAFVVDETATIKDKTIVYDGKELGTYDNFYITTGLSMDSESYQLTNSSLSFFDIDGKLAYIAEGNLYYDGKKQKKYDKIIGGPYSINNKLLYASKKGKDEVLFYDGQEHLIEGNIKYAKILNGKLLIKVDDSHEEYFVYGGEKQERHTEVEKASIVDEKLVYLYSDCLEKYDNGKCKGDYTYGFDYIYGISFGGTNQEVDYSLDTYFDSRSTKTGLIEKISTKENKLIYIGKDDSKSFVVIDGEEQEKYDDIELINTENHLGYIGYNGYEATVVYNGEKLGTFCSTQHNYYANYSDIVDDCFNKTLLGEGDFYEIGENLVFVVMKDTNSDNSGFEYKALMVGKEEQKHYNSIESESIIEINGKMAYYAKNEEEYKTISIINYDGKEFYYKDTETISGSIARYPININGKLGFVVSEQICPSKWEEKEEKLYSGIKIKTLSCDEEKERKEYIMIEK